MKPIPSSTFTSLSTHQKYQRYCQAMEDLDLATTANEAYEKAIADKNIEIAELNACYERIAIDYGDLLNRFINKG